ncbi:hypothetical protein [Erwinia piriflorinigrans]|uniref:Uncharacterized protein n=1 Tax=Erwinia piriflorinigrans CFBP 5888 TaxID=1161919 RepID=V5Z4D3_9GAMM|nr:hypothetical protein [Erwinia piriflorinigrans]CCG85781.1 hypothetical protein EPIR_0416 [Erwinia piriflorinigrans CFBP 5888]
MVIAPLQQARCTDRCQITGGPEPGNWIVPSLPLGWRLVSFHFFVDWNHTPLAVADRIWMTRQLRLDVGDTLDNISKDKILAQFYDGGTFEEFAELERIFAPCGQQVSVILLPEIPVGDIDDNTPIWAIIRGQNGEPQFGKCPVSHLKTRIQHHSGGPVSVGNKGLTYGTSAVECALSRTKAAFPGDADAVIVDDQHRIRYIIEYKKHTLDTPISEHLVHEYYPTPDRRKYQRLEALATRYRRSQSSHIPLVVLYYSTKKPEIRLQEITSMNATNIKIGKDSQDWPVNANTSADVVNWLGKL